MLRKGASNILFYAILFFSVRFLSFSHFQFDSMTDEKKQTKKRKLARPHILPELCYSSKAHKDLLVKVFKLPKPFHHECIKAAACLSWIEPRWLSGYPEVGKTNPRKGQLRWTDAVKQELLVKLEKAIAENEEAAKDLRAFHSEFASKNKKKREKKVATVPEWMENITETLTDGTLITVYDSVSQTTLLGKIVKYSEDHLMMHVSIEGVKEPVIYWIELAYAGIRKEGHIYCLKLEDEVRKARSGKKSKVEEKKE